MFHFGGIQNCKDAVDDVNYCRVQPVLLIVLQSILLIYNFSLKILIPP